jgi:hypothetical protein
MVDLISVAPSMVAILTFSEFMALRLPVLSFNFSLAPQHTLLAVQRGAASRACFYSLKKLQGLS